MAATSTFAANAEHIFLTGHPGVGKTTIVVSAVRAVLDRLSTDDDSHRLRIRGFYTEECRSRERRVGFDLVCFPPQGALVSPPGDEARRSTTSVDDLTTRTSLAREGKPRKGDPAVGKYIVDIENIASKAVPSILPAEGEDDGGDENDGMGGTDLVLLDEVGKMELLCPDFFPAVQSVLDTSRRPPPDEGRRRRRTIVLGTLPTPRYGRVVPAVEDVRARHDVTVVHVTTSNRNELREKVEKTILSALATEGFPGGTDVGEKRRGMKEALKPYLYTRPIGSSSMSGGKQDKSQRQKNAKRSVEPAVPSLQPCGPLLHETIDPKVLLLGETASPQPAQRGMEYSERSMWSVLAEVVRPTAASGRGDDGCKQKGGGKAASKAGNDFTDVRDVVLRAGIGVWDVLSDVHEASSRAKRRKKGLGEKCDNVTPNKIEGLLRDHPSIQALAFIGVKAKKAFAAHFPIASEKDEELDVGSRKVRLIVLPSSSRANSRLSLGEKASAWESVLKQFCPDLID